MHFDKVTLTGLTGLCIPVRPVYTVVPILVVNIWPLFFGKACVPKNTLLNQNCPRAIITNTSAIFCEDDNKLSAMTCFYFKLVMKQFAWTSKFSSWLLALLA